MSCCSSEEHKQCPSLPLCAQAKGNTRHRNSHGGCKESPDSVGIGLESVCTHRQKRQKDKYSKQKTTKQSLVTSLKITRVLHKTLKFIDFSVKCFLSFLINQAPQQLPHSHAIIKKSENRYWTYKSPWTWKTTPTTLDSLGRRKGTQQDVC